MKQIRIFDLKFNQKIITYKYITYADVISYLGGIKSAIEPLF